MKYILVSSSGVFLQTCLNNFSDSGYEMKLKFTTDLKKALSFIDLKDAYEYKEKYYLSGTFVSVTPISLSLLAD